MKEKKREKERGKRAKESVVYTYRSTHGPNVTNDPQLLQRKEKLTAKNGDEIPVFLFTPRLLLDRLSIHSSAMANSIDCNIPSIFFFFSPQILAVSRARR